MGEVWTNSRRLVSGAIYLHVSLAKSGLRYRLASAAFWSLAGAVLSRGISIATWMWLGKILGSKVFGELGILQNTIGMFGAFAGMGLGLTSAKYVAELRGTDPQRTGRIISITGVASLFSGMLLAVVLVWISPWLALRTLHAQHLTAALRISSIMLVLSSINSTQTGSLAGFEAFRRLALINVITSVAAVPVLVISAISGGLVGSVWGQCIVLAINCMLNSAGLRIEAERHGVPLRFSALRSEIRLLWFFSLPAFLAGTIVTPANWVASALLVNKPSGYEQMGLFNAANQWRMAVLFLPGMLANILLPILSNLQNDRRKQKRVLVYNVLLNITVASLVAIGVILFSRQIMSGYGDAFRSGTRCLIIMSVTSILIATSSVFGCSMASQGRMWVNFIFNLLWGVLFVGLAWKLTVNGADGLAMSYLISYLVYSLLLGVYIPVTFRSTRG